MFTPFKLFAKKYRADLEGRFREGSGKTLEHKEWTEWPNRKTTHIDDLLGAIKDKIYLAYRNGFVQDITLEIENNMIDFSNSRTLQEWIAFGGIQELELKGYLSKVKQESKPTIPEVRFEFIIKDRFGVDEEDVYKDSKATHLGREALAAFRVLQHQRGFKPFTAIQREKVKKIID